MHEYLHKNLENIKKTRRIFIRNMRHLSIREPPLPSREVRGFFLRSEHVVQLTQPSTLSWTRNEYYSLFSVSYELMGWKQGRSDEGVYWYLYPQNQPK